MPLECTRKIIPRYIDSERLNVCLKAEDVRVPLERSTILRTTRPVAGLVKFESRLGGAIRR